MIKQEITIWKTAYFALEKQAKQYAEKRMNAGFLTFDPIYNGKLWIVETKVK